MKSIAVKEKRERALGARLFLKGNRCNSPKCAMVRNPNRPGQHGAKRHNVSEFGRQLQEKQKLQLTYGVSNRQLAALFETHPKNKILKLLEHRLDRMVCLMGLARSPRIARQYITHGHITVNNKKVKAPSYVTRPGETIGVREASRLKPGLAAGVKASLEDAKVPDWVSIDVERLSGTIAREMEIDESSLPFNIALVGEYYARS